MQTTYTTQPIEAPKLFGGTSNRYYADPRSRQVRASVHIAADGAFASLEIVRTINYRNEPVETPLVKERIAHSPVVPLNATEVGYLVQWCDEMVLWAAEVLVQPIDLTRDGMPATVERAPTVCPTCDHLNTLRTELQAYGNETTCSRDACNYRDWYSIGD